MYTRLFLLAATLPLAFAATVNYTYDPAGRLIKADYGTAGALVYTYDPAGNLLSRSVQAGATGGVITSINEVGASVAAGVAQNTWIEIRGSNLVSPTTPAAGVIWSNAPEFAQGRMPTQIGDVSVTVNGKPAYVYYYCSKATSTICATDQVNVLTPLDNTTGNVQVVVTSGSSSSAPFTVNVKTVAPSFFLFSGPYVAATHADFTLLGPTTLYPGLSTPAKPNEAVVVYAAGLGLPSATLTSGSAAQSGALPTLPVCKIGNDNAALAFAGLISPGLYQLNLTVPGTAKSGDNAISCTYNGASTPAGDQITVQ
jgi:uncharacterized protein (TIGR03437 family)